MGYNAIDIIDKVINIENRKKEVIKSVVESNLDNNTLNIMIKVLLNQSNLRIKYYQELKEQIKNTELEEIDVMTYDKMSFLINEFNNKVYVAKFNNVKEYLTFSLNLAKDKYSLLIDIQGRLVNNTSNMNTKTYEILNNIIKVVKQQIKSLEKTLSI